MDKYVLNNGIKIPSVGFGTWQITDKDILVDLLIEATNIGYELIDTASAYGNELGIGRFIKNNSSLRSKLFIQDKVWNSDRGYNGVKEALKKSLGKLKTDYIDLYMIHWPASKKLYNNWAEINAETWRGMEDLYKEGFVKSIGICNFKIHHIDELLKTASVIPMVNQVEMHPGLIDFKLIDYCRDKKIHIEASSPLGNGQILNNETLIYIANKYNMLTSKLILNWLLEKGVTIIPKTAKKDRLKDNFIIEKINIDIEDKNIIDNLEFIGGLNIDSDEVVEFG